MPVSILDLIKPRMRVTIINSPLNPAIKPTRHTGTAVMRGPAGWVLNMGGPHGTPAIATEENIVYVPALKYGRKRE